MASLAVVIFTGIAEYYFHAQRLLDVNLQIVYPGRLEFFAFNHSS
jgi:hypothetical protein